MSKTEIVNEIYEKLVSDLIESRANAGFYLLKMAIVVLDAKNKLSKRLWNRWIKDTRIKLKATQAKKFITVAQTCQNGGQLTDLLNKSGIEKTYEVCKIQDLQKQEKFAAQIIDVPFTVKQVKLAVQKIEFENIEPNQAIEEVQNMPKPKSSNSEKQTVSKVEYEKLKNDYEILQKEKQELEIKLKQLEKNKSNSDSKNSNNNVVSGQQSFEFPK